MFAQILRFIFSLFNAYSFYKNPVQYLVTTLIAALVPILIYAIAGFTGFMLLMLLLGFFIYRYIRSNNKASA